jgi:predicted kinase
MRRGVLVIISGPALTGKSTFLGHLMKSIPTFQLVSTDDIRMELYQSYEFKPEREKEIWQITYQRVEALLNKGWVVSLDATLRTPENRGAVINRFRKWPIVYFAFEKPPLSLLLERNSKRTWKQFPEEAIIKMHEDYQFPTDSEKTYYYRVYEVTQENFNAIIESGVSELLNLNE